MSQPRINAQYFRLAVNVEKPATAVKDDLSAATVVLATGAALEFDFVFSEGVLADGTILDLSNFASIEFKIQSPGSPHANAVLIAQSIAAANFQALDLAAHWSDGTQQQITIAIAGADNVLQPTTGSTGNYWLCVYGKLSAAAAAALTPAKQAGDPVPLCYFQISCIDSGIPPAAPALPASFKAGSKLPFLCDDNLTRDLYLGTGPEAVWLTQVDQTGYAGPGQETYSVLCADGLYRDLSLQLQGAAYVLAIDQEGHA